MEELERLINEIINTKNTISALQDLKQYGIIQLKLNKLVQKDMELHYQITQLLNYKEKLKWQIKQKE